MPSPSPTVETGESRGHWVRVGALADVSPNPCAVLHVEGRTVALVRDQGRLYAVDNRCPHMGFPLDRGSVCDGILTCHWHHARFDLATGGTFDQWADDVQAYPVEVRDGELWIDLSSQGDPRQHHLERLQVGLERNIPLVIGKAVLPLVAENRLALEPFQIGLEFGTRYRRTGWGQGLTIHTCLRNLLPRLDPDDQPRAVYHGLAAVANDCDGEPPRFPVRPLPEASVSLPTLKRWFRQFIEVRDAEGAERCVASALARGPTAGRWPTCSSRRRPTIGTSTSATPSTSRTRPSRRSTLPAGSTRKEALTTLASAYASAERMEEANEWRHPIDLVALLEEPRKTSRRAERVPLDGNRTRYERDSSPRSCPTTAGDSGRAARCLRQGARRSNWRDTSPGRPPCGSCSSRRATNSAIGTRPCTPYLRQRRRAGPPPIGIARTRPRHLRRGDERLSQPVLERSGGSPAGGRAAQDPAELLGQLPATLQPTARGQRRCTARRRLHHGGAIRIG